MGCRSATAAVHLTLAEVAGHGLAAGGPKSGKTTFLKLLVEASADRLPVVLVDPKGSPGVWKVLQCSGIFRWSEDDNWTVSAVLSISSGGSPARGRSPISCQHSTSLQTLQGGHFGLTDLTRNGALPPELDGLLAWVACIADALPVVTYATQFTAAGLNVDLIEEHDAVLAELVQRIRGRLVGAELLTKLKYFPVPHDGLDFKQAKALARRVVDAVRTGTLFDTLMIASKPGVVSTAR